jgi:predicted  nucleic acid-binding Zn-ribbon protein
LILYVSRILASISVFAIIAFIFIGPVKVNTITDELEVAEGNYDELLFQLESDKNKSDLALSKVYRTRVDFREEGESVSSEIKSLKSEITGFEAKVVEVESDLLSKGKELSVLEGKLAVASEPMKQIVDSKVPLNEKKKLLEDKREELVKSLKNAKIEADEIEKSFNILEAKRNLAMANFEEERARLMEGIKKPFHLYYLDEKEITVANVAPSGKGFFINKGYDDGFRERMEFISTKENDSSVLPFKLKTTLVQRNFTFLEFIDLEKVNDSSFVKNNEIINIIRSGESLPEQIQNIVADKIE